MKLTKAVIDRSQYEGKAGGRFVLWDSQLSGFGLRIYPSGRKAFILSYRFQGRKRLYTLGDYGVLTLDEARTLAKKKSFELIGGIDPLQVRRKESQGETIRDLCHAFIERYAKPRKKSWEEDQRRFDKCIIPLWGTRKITSITREDAAGLHHRLGKNSGYEANRILALLSKLFETAKRWGMLPPQSDNPARGHDKFTEKKRDRWVKHDELPRIVQAVAAEENIYVRAAIWLYLLTGVRKSELLAARWADIDFHRKELRLDDTKAGRTHYLPLSVPAVKLLEQLPRLEGNPHVLPGHNTGRPLVNISKPWLRIRKAAAVDDVRLHDLRRTVGSMMAQSGESLHLIGRVLNHSNESTTKVYAHFGQDNIRKAIEKHGEEIMSIAHSSSPEIPSEAK
jgi:integrase